MQSQGRRATDRRLRLVCHRAAKGRLRLLLAVTVKGSMPGGTGQFQELASCLIGLDQLPMALPIDSRVRSAAGASALEDKPSAEAKTIGTGEVLAHPHLSATRTFAGEFACVSPMTPPHTPLKLVAVVHEAHRLKAADLNGFSDPYVVLSILDSEGKPVGDATKSRVILKNLNPVWEEAISLPVADLHGDILVQIFDSDFGGALNSDDLLAQYKIPLESLDAQALPLFLPQIPALGVRKARGKEQRPPTPVRLEYKRGRLRMLDERFEARLNKVKGRILEPLPDSPALLPEEQAALRSRVRLPSPDPVPIARPNLAHHRIQDASVAAQLKRMFGLDNGVDDPLHHDQHHAQDHHIGQADGDGHSHESPAAGRELEVIVVRGEHLPKMDTFGSCDGFCILEYGKEHHQTSVQSDTLSPVWEECFTFRIPRAKKKSYEALEPEAPLLPSSTHLKVKLNDAETFGKHRLVGEAIISGARLADIAKSLSSAGEELHLPLYSRRKGEQARAQAQGGSAGSARPFVAVVGNDGEPAKLTLRVRLRPMLPYPQRYFRMYDLDKANQQGLGGAGTLRMALLLQPDVPRGGMTLPRMHCVSEREWRADSGNGDTDAAFKAPALRVSVTAPVEARAPAGVDTSEGAGSALSPAVSPTMSRTMSPAMSHTGSRASGGISPYDRSQAAENVAGVLPVGMIQVRAIAARNLPLSHFTIAGKLSSDCHVSLYVKSNGEEIRPGSKARDRAGMFFETEAKAASLGALWLQAGSICTNFASSDLELEVWGTCASQAWQAGDTLMANGSVDIASLTSKGRRDEHTEFFGWWPLQTKSPVGRRDGHEQHLRVRILQARDLMCARHGDAHPYAIVTVVTNDWEGKPGVRRQTTLHAQHHTKGTDPEFNAQAFFEDIPPLQKHSFLSEQPKIPKREAQRTGNSAPAAPQGWDGCSLERNLGAEGFLLVQLFDAATTFRSAHFLGQAIVPLSAGAAPGAGAPQWHRLHGRGRAGDKLKPRKRPHVADESLGAVELCIELVDRGWLAPHLLLGFSVLHSTRPCFREASEDEKEEAALRGERLLVVTVVSANGLAVADAGGKSDPYCVLSLSASPSAPFLTTSVKEETLFPVWQETGSTYVPRIPAEPTLHVKVMDHDRFGKHDLLGRVDVKLNRLTSGKRYDQWFRVEGSKTSAGMLSVAVRRAKNVPAMDRNGKSDPYCVLRFIDEHGESYARASRNLADSGSGFSLGNLWQGGGVQTRVVYSNLNPHWEESFLLDVPSETAILEVKCFDHDTIGRHDLLGTALIPVASLTVDEYKEAWYHLEVPEGLVPRNMLLNKGGKVEGGDVLVGLCFSPSSPHARPDGSLRLCLQMLDKKQLGEPLDEPSELEKAYHRHHPDNLAAGASSPQKQIEDAIRLRLSENAMHRRVTEDEDQPSSESRLLYNESYLAWAERSSDNYATLSSFL